MTTQEQIDLLIKAGWTEDTETGEMVKGDLRYSKVVDAYLEEFKELPEET